jgi:hypothetical protein
MLTRVPTAIVVSMLACGCSVGHGPLLPIPSPEEAAAARAPADAAAEEAEAWRVTVDAFFDAIRPHVGDPPTECNGNLRQRHVTAAGWTEPEALRVWARCLDTARTTGRPTLVLLWQRYATSDTSVSDMPGPPSWTVTGSLGLSDGRFEAFTYTAWFGSRPGRLTYGPCSSPSPQIDTSGPFGVRCANEDVLGNVPMTSWPPRLFYGVTALTGEHAVNATRAFGRSIARDLGDFACSDDATRSAPPSRRRPGS